MRTPEKLNDRSVSLLLSLLQSEFKAFYFYRAAENWCKNAGFNKTAAYFAKESITELDHAKSIEAYLVDWNVNPTLPGIESPQTNFINLVDIIERAYNLEFGLFGDYTSASDDVFSRKDLATFAVIQSKVQTQVDSVKEYSDMLNVLQGVDIRDKFQLLMIEENLFG